MGRTVCSLQFKSKQYSEADDGGNPFHFPVLTLGPTKLNYASSPFSRTEHSCLLRALFFTISLLAKKTFGYKRKIKRQPDFQLQKTSIYSMTMGGTKHSDTMDHVVSASTMVSF